MKAIYHPIEGPIYYRDYVLERMDLCRLCAQVTYMVSIAGYTMPVWTLGSRQYNIYSYSICERCRQKFIVVRPSDEQLCMEIQRRYVENVKKLVLLSTPIAQTNVNFIIAKYL